MRFKDWIENITPYQIYGPGMDGINNPANTPDTVNSRFYGKGEVKDPKVKTANFFKNRKKKKHEADF